MEAETGSVKIASVGDVLYIGKYKVQELHDVCRTIEKGFMHIEPNRAIKLANMLDQVREINQTLSIETLQHCLRIKADILI